MVLSLSEQDGLQVRKSTAIKHLKEAGVPEFNANKMYIQTQTMYNSMAVLVGCSAV
jgi:hypothetical protein